MIEQGKTGGKQNNFVSQIIVQKLKVGLRPLQLIGITSVFQSPPTPLPCPPPPPPLRFILHVLRSVCRCGARGSTDLSAHQNESARNRDIYRSLS